MLGLVGVFLAMFMGVSTTYATCADMTVTAYSVEMFPGTTYDGTPTRGNAGVIAAASWNIPIGTYVTVEGLGTYRVADRGMLGSSGWIDVLMQTTQEARNWGRQTRTVCY